eukprot:m.2166 g.2166  ORF g.2166 m.2166 type:complete len:1124 (+) comp1732_c0_seq1:81-3452(+)
MDTIIDGFFVKEGGSFKSWKRRWFVLTPSLLYYSPDEKESSWTKSITISSISGLLSYDECVPTRFPRKKDGKNLCFGLRTPTREFHLMGENLTKTQAMMASISLLLLSSGTMDDRDILNVLKRVLAIVKENDKVAALLKHAETTFALDGFKNCRTSNQECIDVSASINKILDVIFETNSENNGSVLPLVDSSTQTPPQEIMTTTMEPETVMGKEKLDEPTQGGESSEKKMMGEETSETSSTPETEVIVQNEIQLEADKDLDENQSAPASELIPDALGHGRSDDIPASALIDRENALSTVDMVWEAIDKQIAFTEQAEDVHDDSPSWKTLRLFVSSTFADMFSEREILIRRVFPKLKQFCSQRHVELIVCDLRWGVPKEATSETVIQTCLGELDSCRERNTNPFFINLLGNRYGWIPTENELNEDLCDEYDWIDNASITHMEIMRGALLDNNPNAAFFIRDNTALFRLPSEFVAKFIDQDVYSQASLARLKDELKARVSDRLFEYKCEFEGVKEEGKIIPTFNKFTNFEENVLNFLQDRIEKQFPISRTKATLTPARYRLVTNDFVARTAASVIGRDDEVAQILGYCRQKFENLTPFFKIELSISEGLEEIMCLAASKAMEQGMRVHFMKSTSGNFEINTIRMVIEEEFEVENYFNFRESAEESDVPIVIFVPDAGNNNFLLLCQDVMYAHPLSLNSKGNLHFVIGINTTSYGDSYYLTPSESLKAHDKSMDKGEYDKEEYNIKITPLTDEEKRAITTYTLAKYNKALDDEQLALFVSNPGAQSYEWVACAAEELRVHGVFETVTLKIASLPSDIHELYALVLKRIREDDEEGMVWKTLVFMACAPNGLKESELRDLLGEKTTDADGREIILPLCMHDWLVIKDSISPLTNIKHFILICFKSEQIYNLILAGLKHTMAEGLQEASPETQRLINVLGENVFVKQQQHLDVFNYFFDFVTEEGIRRAYVLAMQALSLKSTPSLAGRVIRNSVTHTLPYSYQKMLSQIARCSNIVSSMDLPMPERQCVSCANKISCGLAHYNRCATCGGRVAFANPQIGKELEPKHGFSLAYRCRQHAGPFQYMKNAIGLKCYFCDSHISKQSSYNVVLCSTCSTFGKHQCSEIQTE